MGEMPKDPYSHDEVISQGTIRQEADEWLGPDQKFDELEAWEQEALLSDIETDMLQLRVQTVYETETYG